jgi:putative oxygen-independent coproporphyrinogen III oxidase
VPSTLPAGAPAPPDGALPASALPELGARAFGLYVHVPFCAVRCGYCDFNTYTADELGPGAARTTYIESVTAELALAASVLGVSGSLPEVQTVFVGGGTPTLLPADDLVRLLTEVDRLFGLAAGAEVTTEANPDSVTPDGLARLRDGGYTRVSFGMQSSMPHVLATLDRTHDPDRVPQAVGWARAAGFEQVSLDLIHGTPGESLGDWQATLTAALAMRPDHVSAYSLIVEPGTALARRVNRGEVSTPDDDQAADSYELADQVLSQAGYRWYELSNWAREPEARCRHNVAYWRGDDWWGVGPGAHSHVGGVRWWNVKHPAAYAQRLAAGDSPAHAREVLDDETRRLERVLLEVRLVEGLDLALLDDAGRAAVAGVLADGLGALVDDRLVLSLRGRLLADAVVRRLLP